VRSLIRFMHCISRELFEVSAQMAGTSELDISNVLSFRKHAPRNPGELVCKSGRGFVPVLSVCRVFQPGATINQIRAFLIEQGITVRPGARAHGKISLRRKIKRLALSDTFKKLPSCIVGMEACFSAHFVSRTLRALGHEPRIIPAIYVKPFVKGQKNDYNDAPEDRFAARAVLAGNKAKPGAEISSPVEGFACANGGNHGGRDERFNARNAH
jgi:hypothetical protein